MNVRRLTPSSPTMTRPPALAVWTITLAATAVFLHQAWPLRDWIIDDAGVTFAYARNLAAGYGLVSQPGVPPLEGFSNPLWTAMLALSMKAKLFDPVWTPKVLSLALVAVSFAFMAADLLRRGTTPFNRLWPALVGCGLLSLSTSFVIWTTSGLENALLAALSAASCVWCAVTVEDERRSPVPPGMIAGMLALTRPDAAIYAAAFPLLLVMASGGSSVALRNGLRRIPDYLVGLIGVAGTYFVFRRVYFGHWVPNTYVAKDKPSLAFLLDDAKWAELFDAALGSAGLIALAVILVAIVVCMRRAPRDMRTRSIALHLVLAIAGYMLMPLDWMGEFRFASVFFLFFAWAFGIAVAEVQRSTLRAAGAGAAALGLAALTISFSSNAPRARDFARSPVTPYAHVIAFYGDGFNALAALLPNPKGSILAPDIGGTLMTSHLRVYDLVGLCDATTARTLTRDTIAFQRYVLEDIKPTFIHVHEEWAKWSAFHRSQKFLADYVPIAEIWAESESAGIEPLWGDYVRRDALGPTPEATLARLQALYRALGLEQITL